MTLEEILENYSDVEFLKADGFDDAVIGIEQTMYRLVYDIDKMVKILIERDGMTDEEAFEFLDFNVIGAYMGEKTPLYIQS